MDEMDEMDDGRNGRWTMDARLLSFLAEFKTLTKEKLDNQHQKFYLIDMPFFFQ